jgi:hypothetical protein
VHHEIDIEIELNFYGITGPANKLIRSYLLNRYQRVTINNNNLNKFSSQWEEVKYGVPQGSILSPLFFLLYINNFPKIVSNKSNPTLFADDTSIIITNPTPTEFIKKSIKFFLKLIHGFKVIYHI